MAVGLSLTGRLEPQHRVTLQEARDWLARAAGWFEASGDAVLNTQLSRDLDDKPLLLVELHPVADPVEIRIGGSGRIKAIAKTSAAGPGYHSHLCGLLRQFAEDFAIVWDEPSPDHDPGRFFVQRDRTKLERHFLHWLAAECATALQTGHANIGMPRQPRYRHPGPVLTPLGPRSLDWLKQVASDPNTGRDFFAWWGNELTADVFAKRACCDLWLAFAWRPPLTEAEGELVDQIAADLANAYDLDANTPLPWAAWLAILDAIANDTNQYTVEPIPPALREIVASRATDGPAVGYRQFPIEMALSGGWHLEVPGNLAVNRSEDGRTFTIWNDTRTIWFRDQSLGHPEAGHVPSSHEAVQAARQTLPTGTPVNALGRDGIVSEAVLGPYSDRGLDMIRVCGVAAAHGRLAIATIYSTNLDDGEWAVHTWRSLNRH